jgi:arylsulfatase
LGLAQRITATIEIPEGGAEGVILAEGGRGGGFRLFIKKGRLDYAVNSYSNDAGIVY